MNSNDFDALVMSTTENIQYFTGVVEPSLHACGVAILPQRGQPALAMMWLDKEVLKEEIKDITVTAYYPHTQGKVVSETLGRLGATERIGMDSRALTVLANSFKHSLPNVQLINASHEIDELRAVKSEEEIQFIRKACEIADQGMRVALESLKPGMTELQVAAMAEQEMMMLGSDRMKHHPIVASGHRAGLVHPFASQKKIEKGELVAIDLGAVFRGYCSDIARTLVLGEPSEEIKVAFDALRSAQTSVLHKLRPGISIQEIEKTARRCVQDAGYRLIGHMGHGIGLKVEERPFLDSTMVSSPDLKVEKDMVFAFCQGLIVRGKRNLGVRLEDTVVVTESGSKMLTTFPGELLIC